MFCPEDHLARLRMVHQDGTEETDTEPRDAVSLLRISDPDGFSFTLVVSNDKPGSQPQFTSGRFAFLLPTMRVLLSECMGHEDQAQLQDSGFAKASMAYSLTTLRDAVQDPARWFGTTGTSVAWSSLDMGGVFRPINPVRALLAWAAGGASSYAEVAGWVRGGMDAAEVAEWRDAIADPSTGPSADALTDGDVWTDEEVQAWFARFGGGNKRRSPAIRFRKAGLTPDLAFKWQAVAERTPGPLREWIDRFEATGWESQHVWDMQHALRSHHRRTTGGDGWDKPFGVPEVGAWAFMEPDRALGYLAAGFSPDEVMEMEQSGNPVDLHTLSVMAGLLGAPQQSVYF